MAKKQKTFFLPDDLCEVVQAYADKQGTSFTKIVSAALLTYLATPIGRGDAGTMSVAVELEKGKINIAQAFLTLLQNSSAAFEASKVSGQHRKGMSTEEAVLNFFKHALDESIHDLHTAVVGELDATKAVIAVLSKIPSAQELSQTSMIKWLSKGIS